ncbi:MAG: hypothetical protein B6I20_11675 [Bacteroidetes bacterium 4572_117]|nr:MAG: hypothetical protein B6I20_11675 [Bacteroidetes bacterium 4572_117]
MKKTVIYLFSILMFLNACSGKSNDFSTSLESEYAPDMLAMSETKKSANTKPDLMPISNETDQTSEKIEKKIIKTANISAEVEDFKKARTALGALLKKYGAYVADESEQKNDYQISDELTIRVGAGNFDSLLNDVSGLAVHVNSKHIKLADVTEEFIDITTRLKNKKQVEQQYLEILKKAKTISEILQVNEYLRVIREEIESKEGRLKYLNSQVSLSTIYLSMYQNIESADYPNFGFKLLKAVEGGWDGILIFILGLVYIWPFILIVLFVVWLIIRYSKKRKQKQKQA